MSEKTVVWVTEDAMRRSHPVFAEGAEPVFIFDEARLQALPYSVKRLQFIMETLMEMDVPAWRGQTREVLRGVAARHGATAIRIPDSPDPFVADVARALAADFDVEIVADEPFVPPVEGEFHRFFKFWNKVKKPLLR